MASDQERLLMAWLRYLGTSRNSTQLNGTLRICNKLLKIDLPCSGSEAGALTGSGEFGGVPGVLGLSCLLEPHRAKIPFLTGVGALFVSVSFVSSSITEKACKIDQ